jgi:hypothetical protein
MRTITKLAVTAGMLAVPMLVSGSANAAGSVARNQVTTYSVVGAISLSDGSHGTTITATDNTACSAGPSGAFTGTGLGSGANSGLTSTATGTLSGGVLTLHGAYTSPAYLGYTYELTPTVVAADGTFSGTVIDSAGGTYTFSGVASSTTSNYANHGQYVASAGGGSDAAHSCIGMPVQAQS